MLRFIRKNWGVVGWPLRVLPRLFFDKRYLQGRYFDDNLGGWYWAYRGIWFQKILGFNRKVPWPCSPNCTISRPRHVHFHPDDLNNFQTSGTYFQNLNADIYLGRGSYIAPNVGLITANHNLSDLSQHAAGADIRLGENCWIGMNSVVLPGVTLGDNTVVGAGSVVTKSFPDGHQVIAGNPARLLRSDTHKS